MDAAAIEQRVEAVRGGDLRGAARLITQAENGDATIRPLLQALYRHGGHARMIGVTGPPGAGKSTLVDQLISCYRKQGLRVAVLAVDPSSPLTGGAVLGDRLRMGRHDTDAGVFIRSMASRGLLGGLSKAVGDALTVLDAMNWDVIIVETVGVGQNEMDIVRHADCILVLQTALGGDGVQASKAGVLEIGDVFVVNKADAAGSERMVNALNEMIGNRHDHGDPQAWQAMVVSTQAINGTGVDDLVARIAQRFAFLAAHPLAAREHKVEQLRARVLDIAREIAGQKILHRMEGVSRVQALDRLLRRELDPYAFASQMLGDDFPA